MKTLSLATVSSLTLMLFVSGCTTHNPYAQTPAQDNNNLHAYYMNRDKGGYMKTDNLRINRNMTANNLIGHNVLNRQGKKIGTLHDILLDRRGYAVTAVVADTGALGIGNNLAAFDYSRVVGQTRDGKSVVILPQDMVESASAFSYGIRSGAKYKSIHANKTSTKALLNGNVVDSRGSKVADISDLYFHGNDPAQVIAGFNRTFGGGGDLALLPYGDFQLVNKGRDSSSADLRLSAPRAAQFSEFRQSVAN